MAQHGRNKRKTLAKNSRQKTGLIEDNDNKRPLLGLTAVRLYRNDPLWRSALDLTVIGAFIMLLSNGFPDTFKGLDKFTALFMPSVTPQQASSPAAVSPASLQQSSAVSTPAIAQPAANFTSAPLSSVNNQPFSSTLPKPAKSDSTVQRIWIGNVLLEDKATLEKASDLIGTDNQQAVSLLKAKAVAGDSNFQYLMGVVHINEASIFHSPTGLETAIYWYKEAAGLGHPVAQFQLGQIYRIGITGIPRDFEEAVKWYEMAKANPENKTGEAENELGRLYEKGVVFPKDIKKAVENYALAAAKGERHAQSNLGALYYNGGPLLPRDVEKAIRWTSDAAQNGDISAQMNLALMYLRGRINGQPNYTQFLKWAGLSAEQGNVEAMIQIGNLYHEGKPGFDIDQKQAAKFYRLAALKKHPKGQFLFAEMYEQGYGVPKDAMQAYVYYTLSYKGGYTPAFEALQSLTARMSAGDLDYAQRMTKALTVDDSVTK